MNKKKLESYSTKLKQFQKMELKWVKPSFQMIHCNLYSPFTKFNSLCSSFCDVRNVKLHRSMGTLSCHFDCGEFYEAVRRRSALQKINKYILYSIFIFIFKAMRSEKYLCGLENARIASYATRKSGKQTVFACIPHTPWFFRKRSFALKALTHAFRILSLSSVLKCSWWKD